MTEIERIKEYIAGKNLSSETINSWLSSLITTIESQKEEIERLKECEMELVLADRVIQQKKEMLQDVEKRMSEVIDSRDKALDEIESLKAITELAVKGLKEIKPVIKWKTQKCDADCMCPFCDSMLVINLTLSEIERLSK